MVFKVLFYRVFQFFFYKAPYLLKWRKPVLLTGGGSLNQFPDVIKKQGAGKVLVITDGGLMKTGLPEKLFAVLEREGVPYALYDGVVANPTIDNVEQARRMFLEGGCGGFVAFGGGSPIDTAKAAAARIARPKRTVSDMRGFLKVRRTVPPVFAVPTTAGTGSEVTVAAVITDGKTHHKYAINDPLLIPVCAVLDPELTVGLPASITAATGMDALTHAVEAYITYGADKHPRRLAEEAIRLIYENLPEAYANGGNLDARQNMLLASYKAGDSFTRAGLTYAHPLAHALGGIYNETHGLANAVLLPYVLESFGKSIYRKLALLAAAAGLDVSGMRESDAAAAFIESIRQLNSSMNIPDKLVCIKSGDVPLIVGRALAEANPWYPVPKIFGREELTAVLGLAAAAEKEVQHG